MVLEVLGKTATSAEPAERALHDPTLGEHHKAFGRIRAVDDLEWYADKRQNLGSRGRALVTAVARDFWIVPHMLRTTVMSGAITSRS